MMTIRDALLTLEEALDEALGAEAGPVRTSLQETIDAAVCKLIAAPAVAENGGKKK